MEELFEAGFGGFEDPHSHLLEGPFDSPAERAIAGALRKILTTDVHVQLQCPVATEVTTFVLDFVLEIHGRRIGLECDGKAYHIGFRDHARDALILATGKINEIIRVPAQTISFHIHDIIYLLVQVIPGLASERGRVNASRLVSPYALDAISSYLRLASDKQDSAGRAGIEVWYPIPDNDPDYRDSDEPASGIEVEGFPDAPPKVLDGYQGRLLYSVLCRRRKAGFEFDFVKYARTRRGWRFDKLVSEFYTGERITAELLRQFLFS